MNITLNQQTEYRPGHLFQLVIGQTTSTNRAVYAVHPHLLVSMGGTRIVLVDIIDGLRLTDPVETKDPFHLTDAEIAVIFNHHEHRHLGRLKVEV